MTGIRGSWLYSNNRDAPLILKSVSPLARNIVPKLTYIDKNSQFTIITPSLPLQCPKLHSTTLTSQHVATAIKVIHQLPIHTQKNSILITVYRQVNKCSVNFLGSQTKTTTSEELSSFDHLDQEELFILLGHIQENQYDLNWEHIEESFLGKEQFECYWMRETTVNVYLIRYKAIHTEWDLHLRLISPSYQPLCVANGRYCNLSSSSRLLPPKLEEANYLCQAQFSAVISGDLFYKYAKDNHLTPQYFISSSKTFYLSWTDSFYEFVVCQNNLTHDIIYSSLEGILFQWATHQGEDILTYLRRIQTHQDERLRRKRFMVPLNLTIFNSHASTSIQAKDVKNSNPDINGNLPPIDVSWFVTPILPTAIFNIKENSNTSSARIPREVTLLSQTPSELHSWWLLEHASWTYSELESSIYQLRNETTFVKQRDFKLECENHYSNLLLGIYLFQMFPRLYLEYFLLSTNFIIHKTETGKVSYSEGIRIKSINLSQPFSWCNGHLKVSGILMNENSYEGFLQSDIGVVIGPLDINCTSRSSPTRFYIPTLNEGSFELISSRYVFKSYIDADFNQNPLNFIPNFKFNVTEFSELNHLQQQLSHLLSFNSETERILHLSTSANPTSSSPESWVFSNLVLPIISLIIPFIVLYIIFRLVIWCCVGTTKSIVHRFSAF